MSLTHYAEIATPLSPVNRQKRIVCLKLGMSWQYFQTHLVCSCMLMVYGHTLKAKRSCNSHFSMQFGTLVFVRRILLLNAMFHICLVVESELISYNIIPCPHLLELLRTILPDSSRRKVKGHGVSL